MKYYYFQCFTIQSFIPQAYLTRSIMYSSSKSRSFLSIKNSSDTEVTDQIDPVYAMLRQLSRDELRLVSSHWRLGMMKQMREIEVPEVCRDEAVTKKDSREVPFLICPGLVLGHLEKFENEVSGIFFEEEETKPDDFVEEEESKEDFGDCERVGNTFFEIHFKLHGFFAFLFSKIMTVIIPGEKELKKYFSSEPMKDLNLSMCSLVLSDFGKSIFDNLFVFNRKENQWLLNCDEFRSFVDDFFVEERKKISKIPTKKQEDAHMKLIGLISKFERATSLEMEYQHILELQKGIDDASDEEKENYWNAHDSFERDVSKFFEEKLN